MASLSPRILRNIEQVIRSEAALFVSDALRPFLNIEIQASTRVVKFSVVIRFDGPGRGGHCLFAGTTKGQSLEVYAWGSLAVPNVYRMNEVRAFLRTIMAARIDSIERHFQLSRHLVGLPATCFGGEGSGFDVRIELDDHEDFVKLAAALRKIISAKANKPKPKIKKPEKPPRPSKTIWQRL